MCSIDTKKDHLECVECCKIAKDDVRKFLKVIIEDESCMTVFDEFFSAKLVKELETYFFSCVSLDVPVRFKHVKGEKLWRSFHQLRISKLSRIWHNLFQSNEVIPKLSPLVYQSISQQLYSHIINCHLGAIQIPGQRVKLH